MKRSRVHKAMSLEAGVAARWRLCVRKVRQRKGIGFYELCEKTGLRDSTLSQIETGRTNARWYQLILISEALECRIDDLFEKRLGVISGRANKAPHLSALAYRA